MQSLGFLQPAIALLHDSLDILPAVGGAVEDLLQPDVGRTGISELMKIAHMAEAFNIPVAPHLSVGLGLCIAASIHLAAAISNLWMLEYQPPSVELANSVLETGLVCERGLFRLPEGPGLGVTIDEAKLKAAQV